MIALRDRPKQAVQCGRAARGRIAGMDPQRYAATARDGGRGRLFVPVPFDPDGVWRPKPRHPIAGTINGMPLRGVIEEHAEGRGIMLGPAWLRACGVAPGDELAVEIWPEGPQRDELAEDVAAALAA